MHEMSIADALVSQVRRHTPMGQVAKVLRVEAGPLQAVDGDALQMAWQAMTLGTELASCELILEALPYKLSCPKCGREWTNNDPFDPCACGNDAISQGSDELRLVSMEVEPVDISQINTDVHAEI